MGARAPPCPPLAPVLFRVPALFGVFRRGERRSLSCSSPLHLLCLRTHWPLRALRPLLWDRPRRAARRALRLRQLLLLHRAMGQSARLPLLCTTASNESRISAIR